ncbi:hypothetical protein CLAFUW4_02828 [Fulvia fulva]|uniref:Uncharacterized protein n=1 Tax=Passalora fulva TaxID=5499 RepID=A0A9Q8P508_PASFU|nr:uncharacterized protein CLAFUR5_02815 [Fulvia fulva]KAK4631524.1 hypothetical protein CLAFUR4_02822 [Fulvia fulva]KAK4633765.1 hypothetical protein CLAFUR0_02824 [Fulvia fulva]UJO13396.1 hypothetical protein CLAFUR5_02815 [Fulvia fulva]WPV11022.1 hypothetical protein CLAFUW4_02828 [Fulvia fulva]WPV26876.1 hypothetical protein CLAFUW7_02826 [Fulvia fulva]
METMTASNYTNTPLAQTTSHMRTPQPDRPSKATRPVQAGDPQQPLSAPASQESMLSVNSAASSVMPRLQASDSNLSQLTTYTDNSSPSSSVESTARHASHTSHKTAIQRQRTPDDPLHTAYLNGDHALASPMSITSPALTNGAKRTASGHVKNAPSLPNTPYTTTFPGRASRRESISSSGSRAGELAATLKTRLGYAMAKVQNGWEHKQLHEVEQLAAYKARPNRHSMSHIDQRPGTSGLSNGTSRLTVHDNYHNRDGLNVAGAPPSKRHSGHHSGILQQAQHYTPSWCTTPRLQPAPEIRPNSSSRQYPPQGTSHFQQQNNAMSPPRTPVSTATSRRPPAIRTELQTAEAERDALQALFQLGSPHTSQMPRSATAASSQASPQKMNLDTPRRVTFARSESDSSGGSGHVQYSSAGVLESQS